MKKINVNMEITFSKFISLLLLISITMTSIWLKAPVIMLVGMPIIGGIIANKQYQDRIKNVKETTKE